MRLLGKFRFFDYFDINHKLLEACIEPGQSLWIVSFQAYWFVSFHDWVFLESSESKLFQAFHRSHRGAPEVAHASPKSH